VFQRILATQSLQGWIDVEIPQSLNADSHTPPALKWRIFGAKLADEGEGGANFLCTLRAYHRPIQPSMKPQSEQTAADTPAWKLSASAPPLVVPFVQAGAADAEQLCPYRFARLKPSWLRTPDDSDDLLKRGRRKNQRGDDAFAVSAWSDPHRPPSSYQPVAGVPPTPYTDDRAPAGLALAEGRETPPSRSNNQGEGDEHNGRGEEGPPRTGRLGFPTPRPRSAALPLHVVNIDDACIPSNRPLRSRHAHTRPPSSAANKALTEESNLQDYMCDGLESWQTSTESPPNSSQGQSSAHEKAPGLLGLDPPVPLVTPATPHSPVLAPPEPPSPQRGPEEDESLHPSGMTLHSEQSSLGSGFPELHPPAPVSSVTHGPSERVADDRSSLTPPSLSAGGQVSRSLAKVLMMEFGAANVPAFISRFYTQSDVTCPLGLQDGSADKRGGRPTKVMLDLLASYRRLRSTARKPFNLDHAYNVGSMAGVRQGFPVGHYDWALYKALERMHRDHALEDYLLQKRRKEWRADKGERGKPQLDMALVGLKEEEDKVIWLDCLKEGHAPPPPPPEDVIRLDLVPMPEFVPPKKLVAAAARDDPEAQLYLKLKEKASLLGEEALFRWDRLQALLASGQVSRPKLQQIFASAHEGRNGGFLSMRDFGRFLRGLEDHLDQLHDPAAIQARLGEVRGVRT
jgi:hypothetical protein